MNEGCFILIVYLNLRNGNLEPIDQILAVNEHYLDKNGFQIGFNELISNRLNLVELLVKKNELKKQINHRMTFRDMVVSISRLLIPRLLFIQFYLEQQPV